jgi:hypothetical protein
MNDKQVVISIDLAKNLLDDANELIAELQPLRGYDKYDRRIARHLKDIAELNAAIDKAKSA